MFYPSNDLIIISTAWIFKCISKSWIYIGAYSGEEADRWRV